jgi:hypothetical protein
MHSEVVENVIKIKKTGLSKVLDKELTMAEAFACGRLFDLHAGAFKQTMLTAEITDDFVMTDEAFFEFIATSDTAAHVGLTQTQRLWNALRAMKFTVDELPKGGDPVPSITFPVKVLDPDGRSREKELQYSIIGHPEKPGQPLRVFEILGTVNIPEGIDPEDLTWEYID